MDSKRLCDLLADGHGGIERGHGVLKDHADVSTSYRVRKASDTGKVLTLKPGRPDRILPAASGLDP